LPQPDGPSIEKNSPRPIVEGRVVDRGDIAVALADVLDATRRRCASVQGSASVPSGVAGGASGASGSKLLSRLAYTQRASCRARRRSRRAARRASAGSRRSSRRCRSQVRVRSRATAVVSAIDVVAEERLEPLQVVRAVGSGSSATESLPRARPLLEARQHDVEAARGASARRTARSRRRGVGSPRAPRRSAAAPRARGRRGAAAA
jgi:hypothetical protein